MEALKVLHIALRGGVDTANYISRKLGIGLGETTPDHHNEWAGTNWISFELNDDSLMRFLGPRRYFGVQNPDVADDLRSWYDESERQFGAGRIRSGESGLPAGENVALVDQLGGEPGYGNWVAFRPPAALALDESNPVSPTLRLADGRPFTFIAATAGLPMGRARARRDPDVLRARDPHVCLHVRLVVSAGSVGIGQRETLNPCASPWPSSPPPPSPR